MEKWFEWRFGKETSGYWYLDEHGLPFQDRVWYDPSEWRALHRAFERLKPAPSDVLVDVGCGKGRGLLVAGRFSFGKIVGVELSPQMTEVARASVEKNLRKLDCRNIELMSSDILEYDFSQDVTVLYMYCPFVGEVFVRFLERFLEFADRSPHPLRLLYNYPFHHNLLLETRRFAVVDVCSAKWPATSLTLPEVIITYRVLRRGERADSGGFVGHRGSFPREGRCWLGPYDPGFVVWRAPGQAWYSSPAWERKHRNGESVGRACGLSQ